MRSEPQKQNPAGGRGSVRQRATGQAPTQSSGYNALSLEQFLSRVDRVRKTGAGYTARCPAHEDRTASLSVTAGNDGRVLVHCFAGCSIGDVLGSVGLTVGDLFPRRITDPSPEARRELQGLALRAELRSCANVLDGEASVVLIAAGDLQRGRTLSADDHARLALAAERIHAARVAIGGAR